MQASPQWALLPVGWEAHLGEEGAVEGEEVVEQPARPMGVRLDDADHVGEEDEGVVEPAVFRWVEVGDKAGRRAARQLEGDGEAAVPKARMVGTKVAYVRAVLEERLKDLG